MGITDSQKAIAVMCGAYSGRFTEEQAMIYDRVLSDIHPVLLGKAIESLIRSRKFPPSVAEIREEAERIYKMANGEKSTSASHAWGEVKEQIRISGYYRKPKFSDEICARVVNDMGWQEICQSEDPEGVLRGQFIKMYESEAERAKTDRRISRAIGDGKVQALIGQVSKAKAISSKQGVQESGN